MTSVKSRKSAQGRSAYPESPGLTPNRGSGPYKPREPQTLKDATALLVQACGGLGRAANLVRVGRSTLARYSDHADPECFMPADVILALELHCGELIVTRFLAGEQDCDVSTVKYDPSLQTLADDVAALAREFGDVIGLCSQVIADPSHPITAARRALLVRDLNEAVAVIFHMRGRLVEGRG